VYLPQALELPETLPEPPGWDREPDQDYPPTPAMPIRALPEPLEEPPVPLIPLEYQTPAALPPVQDETRAVPSPAGKGLRRTLVAILVLACLGGGGTYLWLNRSQAMAQARVWLPWAFPAAPTPRIPVPPPAVKAVASGVAVPPPAVQPVSSGVAVPPPAAQPASAVAVPPPAVQPAKPLPEPKAAEVDTSIPARLAALDKGDLDLAVRQGQRLAKTIPPGQWTLRLEIACQGDTIQRLVGIFKGRDPDIFLLPIAMRDGRVCYQVLYGRFPTQLAADKQLKHLPASFLADRNRPKKFRFSELPKIQ